MINPFSYGGVVGKDSFCNRAKELEDLFNALKSSNSVFLYSERRLGKTSLAKLALAELPKREYLTAYVDLWPTDGEASLALAIAQAITQNMASTADRMLTAAKRFFGRLVPTMSVDDEGKPKIFFALSGDKITQPELREVLTAPQRVADQKSCRVVIVLDEFQRILEYGDDSAERTIRSIIQDQPSVSYVFLGSRKHLIKQMFLDSSRPLFRSAMHYPLGPISTDDWLPFVRSRFRKTNKKISAPLIRQICEITGGHPFYTQHLCHAVWEITEPEAAAEKATLKDALRLVLDRENYAYTGLWESFTLNQQRFLTGLATTPHDTKVYGADFLRAAGVRAPSTAHRAAKGLHDRDIIDRDNGSYIITDRFFKLWIAVNSPHTKPQLQLWDQFLSFVKE